MKSKTIHFYEYDKNDCEICHSWNDTQNRINNGDGIIRTTQMGLLSATLFEHGYKIFIHESETECYEIVLGGENERTSREIRESHNLFKLWKAGEFISER